jgi:hypothetical protein
MNFHQILNFCIRFLSIRMVLFSLFLTFRAKKSLFICLLFEIFNSNQNDKQNNSFFQESLELTKLFPVDELTPPASQDSASSDSSFRLELLPSQESVAPDSSVESEQNVSGQPKQIV